MNKSSSASINRIILVSILSGLFAAGLIYLADWKMESIGHIYVYIGYFLIVSFASFGGAYYSMKNQGLRM